MRRSNNPFPLIVFAIIGLGFFIAINEEEPAPSQEATSLNADSVEASVDDGLYRIPFSENFNPGASSIDDLGISIVLALDTSGSMADPPLSGGSTPKIEDANRALVEIVSFLQKLVNEKQGGDLKIRLGIIRFYNEVEEVFPLTTMDAQAFERVQAALADPGNFDAGGRTAIGLALETGAEMLAQSGTILRSLIVVSDGENTEGVEPDQVLEALYANRNSASNADFTVSTASTLVSFIGFDLDTSVFAGLHDQGARLTAAQDRSELVESLKDIFVADITKLEAVSN